jgi:hypothetical protein
LFLGPPIDQVRERHALFGGKRISARLDRVVLCVSPR